MADANQDQPNDDRRNFFVGIGFLLVVVVLAMSICSGAGGPYSGSVDSFEPIDVANLRVNITITNEGDDAGEGECTVEAYDAGGRVVGFDILSSQEDIGGGETFRGTGVIRIEDEGAFRVEDVTASECESA